MLLLFVGLRVGALITESAPILARRVDQNQSPTEGAGVIMKRSADTNVLAQEVTPIGGADPATQNHPEDDIYTQPNLNLLSTFQLTMRSFASYTILFGSSSTSIVHYFNRPSSTRMRMFVLIPSSQTQFWLSVRKGDQMLIR